MLHQISFSRLDESRKNHKTNREKFLEEMEKMIPWKNWIGIIEKYYYKGENGRPPKNIELMLRMYLVQNWFTLSDEATEDAVYDSIAVRKFVGIDIIEEDVPDSTTLLRFRHLLEKNKLQEKFFQQVEQMLEKNKIIVKKGTIVDATIITAPTSVKNAEKKRDPEAKSTKKGNQYYFGYKAHIGVDSESGLVHTNVVTSANEHDVTVTNELLHGEEQSVYGDSGYLGADKRENAPEDVEWEINRRPSTIKKLDSNDQLVAKAEESMKSHVRAKVEHVFAVVKNVFKFRKTRYRGLDKNTQKMNMLFALSNLYLISRRGFSTIQQLI